MCRTIGRAVMALVSLLVLAAPGPAARADVPTAATPSRSGSHLAMRNEMRAVIDAERVTLEALNARFRQSADAEAGLAIQREIAQLKVQTELSLLRIQARHARAAGRATVADAIERAIREIESPPVPLPAGIRPVPAPGTPATPAPTR